MSEGADLELSQLFDGMGDEEFDDILVGLSLPEPTGPELQSLDDEPDGEAFSAEVIEVSRRIAGQFVDLIVAFAGHLFTGTPSPATTGQFMHTLQSLSRLAAATGDTQQRMLLDEMIEATTIWDGGNGRRARDRLSTRLREWLPRFAAGLDQESSDRLRTLVEYRSGTIPLFAELGNIPGIGRRRLERLYCAGLCTVEAVCAADPSELAMVTGLPQPLASQVVLASQQYAVDQRRRCARELAERAHELMRALRNAPADKEVTRLTTEAARELQLALAHITGET